MDTLKKSMRLNISVFDSTDENKEALKNTQNFGKKPKEKPKQ